MVLSVHLSAALFMYRYRTSNHVVIRHTLLQSYAELDVQYDTLRRTVRSRNRRINNRAKQEKAARRITPPLPWGLGPTVKVI